MKRRILKRIISLVIVVVMVVSTMTVSMVSISALEIPKIYRVFIKVDFMQVQSNDEFEYTLVGENGRKSFNYSLQGKKVDFVTVESSDLGELESIEIVGLSGSGDLYIDNIKVTDFDGNVTEFNGGKCLNGEKVVLSKINKVDEIAYNLEFTTSYGEGVSNDDISVKINGNKGSTDWHNIGKVGSSVCNIVEIISKIDIGTIESITLKNNGSDNWFPENIIIKKNIGNECDTANICCGKWIKGQEVTFDIGDRAFKITVKTSNNENAGTKGDVYVKIYDYNGNATEEINLTELHSDPNGFETKVKESFVIYAPKNFGIISKIEVRNDDTSDEWYLEYIDVTLKNESKRFYAYKNIGKNITTLEQTKCIYEITVKTGEIEKAGTDCDVYLYAYNAKGERIGKYELDTDGNSFEKGKVDVVRIEAPEKIADIQIETMRDYWDASAGKKWYCSYIQINQYVDSILVESIKYNYELWVEPGIYAENNIFQTIPAEHYYYKPTSTEVLVAEE